MCSSEKRMKLDTAWNASEVQIGGHRFVKAKSGRQVPALIDLEDGYILKAQQPPPRGERELKFYQQVWGKSVASTKECDLDELRNFLPGFAGTVERDGASYIKLTNINYGMKSPCVLDLKMGRVTYDQEASPEKIANEIKKFPPLKQLGFQITGMMIYDPEKQCYNKYTKEYTRKLTKDTIVSEGLAKFFLLGEKNFRQDILPPLLNKLHSLENWFSRQKQFSFIASSILVVYDGSSDVIVSRSEAEKANININTDRLLEDTKTSANKPDVCEDGTDTFSVKLLDKSYISTGPGLSGDKSASSADTNCKTDDKISIANNKSPESSDGTSSLSFKHHNKNATEKSNNGIAGSMKIKSDSCQDKVRLYFIDFAHVFPSTQIDENVLFGIRKLISCLQTFIR